LQVLGQVRKGDPAEEAGAIHQQLIAEQAAGEVSYAEILRNKNLRRRVLVACLLQAAQQLTGVNAFLGYSSTLFDRAGFHNRFQINVVWNAVQCVGNVVGLLLIDSPFGGRRLLLLGATVVMGPTLLVAGSALQFHWSSYITLAMLMIYGFFFQLAWGTIPWVYPSEIFTMSEKEKAISLAVFWQYAINAVVYFVTPPMIELSTAGTFIAFGVLNLLNFVFVAAFVRETRGVPLEHAPALFGAHVQ